MRRRIFKCQKNNVVLFSRFCISKALFSSFLTGKKFIICSLHYFSLRKCPRVIFLLSFVVCKSIYECLPALPDRFKKKKKKQTGNCKTSEDVLIQPRHSNPSSLKTEILLFFDIIEIMRQFVFKLMLRGPGKEGKRAAVSDVVFKRIYHFHYWPCLMTSTSRDLFYAFALFCFSSENKTSLKLCRKTNPVWGFSTL